MSKIPELGIGIIYFSGFKSMIESNFNLINLIEIEPQTFWLKNRAKLDSFIFNEEELSYLKSLDKPKTFHGVGYPVASSLPMDSNHIPYLKDMMQSLNPIWMSEHLSFNNISLENKIYNTNFLLPPLQTIEGIHTASESIKKYRSNFDIPFAFETGVSYLKPNDFELDDGTFVNTIAENSDSYILLDIHNLLANQKNGRQSVLEFINQINLERVIQIHVAGGFDYNGYYLDAHSNVSSDEVFALLEKIVKKLPNLKAIIFEMLPDYLNFVSKKDLTKQLEKMASVWDKRGAYKYTNHTAKAKSNKTSDFIPKVKDWETTLGCLAIEKNDETVDNKLKNILSADKGVTIIQELVKKFKRSMLVSSMRLTCRYLMLQYGVEYLETVFEKFWQNSKPLLFATDNGLQFGEFLIEKFETQDEILLDLVRFELNSLKTLLDDVERQVLMKYNPNEMLASLSEGKLPVDMTFGNFEIIIEPTKKLEKEQISAVFHS